MRITLIGGAGVVGQSLIPHLSARNELRVLDLVPLPEAHGVEGVVGDALDMEVLATSMENADAVVHLAALVPKHLGPSHPRTRRAFDVNVYGIYAALSQAAAAGVRHFLHASSLSVYREYGSVPVDTSLPPDSADPYGLSKLLAEEVCARVAAQHPAMTITSLRLAVPTTEELWPLWRSPSTPDAEPTAPRFGDKAIAALHPSDLAAAIEWALGREGGYRALSVAGDLDGVTFAGDRGWQPRFRGAESSAGASSKA